jgi:superoxide dismutase, Fe-Mn family
MEYEQKNFDGLLGTEGFSDILLQNHFKLYAGYVANTNKTIGLMKTLQPGTLEYAEVRRRFGWEFNGMRLHEQYFGNLVKGGKAFNPDSDFAKLLAEQFGSFEAWEKDFKSVGSFRGIGWVILAYDAEANKLFNVWINEHDVGHLAGAKPLLVLDVFEHAFITDYGLKKADYITAFFKAINWETVVQRM